MAMRRRSNVPHRCRRCRLERFPEETFVRGFCPACLQLERQERRAKTGARALAKAKDAGTVERDGKAYRVLVLPPKWRGGSRIR
jgi:hypothetical protein